MRVMMRNQNFTHCAANAMGFCEWQAAGLAYFRALRAAGATLRGKRAAGCDFAFRFSRLASPRNRASGQGRCPRRRTAP